jgi:hypothetical protein
MVKILAQLKNLRRGHDTQGVSKKVSIDASRVGYANYMAPMRLKEIELKIKEARKNKELTEEQLEAIFPSEVRKPATATYLTTEWDEMVPFPTSKFNYTTNHKIHANEPQLGNYASMAMVSQTIARTTTKSSRCLRSPMTSSLSISLMGQVTLVARLLLLFVSVTTHGRRARARVRMVMRILKLELMRFSRLVGMHMRLCQLHRDARLVKRLAL